MISPIEMKKSKAYGQVCEAIPEGIHRDHALKVLVDSINHHQAVTGYSNEHYLRQRLAGQFKWSSCERIFNLPSEYFIRIHNGSNPYV